MTRIASIERISLRTTGERQPTAPAPAGFDEQELDAALRACNITPTSRRRAALASWLVLESEASSAESVRARR
jgi:hypothetical protein